MLSTKCGPITKAIHAIGNLDESGVEVLWDRYFERLCEFAEVKICRRQRSLVSSDEVASDALLALVDGIRRNRFRQVGNQNEAWQMLTLIAARKAINACKRLRTLRRGGATARGESAFLSMGDGGINNVVDFLQREPSPSACAELSELSDRLLAALPSQDLREIAICRMAGHSNCEIAQKIDRTERTVERKLNLIRTIWGQAESIDI